MKNDPKVCCQRDEHETLKTRYFGLTVTFQNRLTAAEGSTPEAPESVCLPRSVPAGDQKRERPSSHGAAAAVIGPSTARHPVYPDPGSRAEWFRTTGLGNLSTTSRCPAGQVCAGMLPTPAHSPLLCPACQPPRNLLCLLSSVRFPVSSHRGSGEQQHQHKPQVIPDPYFGWSPAP